MDENIELNQSLMEIAGMMKQADRKQKQHELQDYYQLAKSHYENLKLQQSKQNIEMEEQVLLKIAEQQLAELIRMGQVHKLMNKIAHIKNDTV